MDQKNSCRNRSGLYDSGVIALIEAIVRQAAKDHLAALRRHDRRGAARLRETRAFFRSAFFSRLTGISGEHLLQRIEKEAEKHDRA
ncbi:MAG: hypothetical protein K6F61_07605 [Clostridiales bacterium]|nr:hypothetical protein [Clostridia bacterium]MCR5566703.1 hypothetical protein [Clostridiales bacterium]